MANSLKLKKYHFLYKTTNLLNGKYYIGVHSTSNLKDGYLGSGTHLRRAIRKYGKQHFKCVILYWFKTRKLLLQREKQIVNEALVKNPMCMNLKTGGSGGFEKKDYLKGSILGNKRKTELLKTDKEFRDAWINSLRIAMNRRARLENNWHKCGGNWLGKKHKPESIEKMKLSALGKHIGALNSQYGTMWITNGKENKKINKNEPIPVNWYNGRILKNIAMIEPRL